jgi:hypothetical protein
MTFFLCLAGLAILIFGLSRVSIGLEERSADRLPIGNDATSLEPELEAALERESHRRHWEWINTPIAIWILTTIAAGTVGYLYTNYSVCRTAQSADDNTISRIVLEATARSDHVLKLYKDNKYIVDDNLVSQLKDYLTTDKGYALREFKEKSVLELGVDADVIRKKWHLRHDDPVVTIVINEVLSSLEGVYTEVNGSFYGYKPDKKLIKDALVQLDVCDECGEDLSDYITPSVCVNKALWPF